MAKAFSRRGLLPRQVHLLVVREAFSWNIGAVALTATPMDGKVHGALGAGATDVGIRPRGAAACRDRGSARHGGGQA